MRLQDKSIIVTGSANGISKGIAKRLAQEGAKVVVNDINAVGGQRVAAEIVATGGQAIFVAADMTKSAEVKTLVESAVAKFGGLHAFVNTSPQNWALTTSASTASTRFSTPPQA